MTSPSPEQSEKFMQRRSTEVELEWLPKTPLTPRISTVVELEWLPEIRRDDLVGLIGSKFFRVAAKSLHRMADRFSKLSGDR